MFLRSFVLIKYLRCNVGRLSTNAEQVILLGLSCNHRTFSILSSRKCDNTLNDNVIFKRDSTVRDKSLLRILLFSNIVSDSKVPDLNKDKDSDGSSSKGLTSKSNTVDINTDSMENLPKTVLNDISVVKHLELKSNGKKLILEATADTNSNITNIVLKKETISPNPNNSPKVSTRLRVDLTASSLERNFITPVRAMSDFMLKPSDLDSLPKTKRRSPYELEPPITVYWRRDVEAKATEVWGSRENLKKELLRKEIEHRRYQQNVFTVKRRLRDYRREISNSTINETKETGLSSRSGRVVLTAVAINGSNFLFKLFAWLYTGSHSMFSECIHSLADTINQLILAYGIHKSDQEADTYHPYGYSNMRYVASLISGVGIFCVGTGLSYYHGVMGLLNPHPMESFYYAYFILGGAIVSEGATLLVAINAIKKGAKEADMPFKEYVLRGSDPSVNVVLLEDMAAVGGVAVAAGFMGLSSLTGNPQWDACGSLFVGTILGGVASFIILTNVGALVGRSIPQEQLDKINSDLEADIMVRAIHDVKGIDMGSNLVRYKAELDFDGRELTRAYLDKQDLNALLEEIKKLQTLDELEGFLLKHGENIVDMMGGEIDRIELKLRKRFPYLRHCDLEIL